MEYRQEQQIDGAISRKLIKKQEVNAMDAQGAQRLYCWFSSARALSNVLIANRPKIHGPLLTGWGQEAIGVGIIWGLYELGIVANSWKDPDHRTIFSFLPAVGDIVGANLTYEFFKHYYAKRTSAGRGRDGSCHIGFLEHRIGGFDVSHMGAMVGVSLGKAEALRVGEYGNCPESLRPIVVSCFGEGAAQQGIVHEAMNWAAASNAKLSDEELQGQEKFLDEISRTTHVLRGAPIVFVMNVNQKSIYVGAREEHGDANKGRPSHLANRALGYPNMWGVDVNGDDVSEVADAVKIAARRAQRLEGASLVVAHTYRRTAHNEDQRATLSPYEKEELKKWVSDDPLVRLQRSLLERHILDADMIRQIDAQALQDAENFSSQALAEPDVTVEDDAGNPERFAPHVYSAGESGYRQAGAAEEPSGEKEAAALLSYRDAARSTVQEILRSDQRATFCGEDIAHPSGGVLGMWQGLVEEFGNQRVFNTPISEEALVGNLAGRALGGMRPWGEFEFAPFGKESLVQIDYVIGPNYYQKGRVYPLVLLNHFGIVGEGGSGHYHSNCTEADFYHNQGWKIVFPADAYDMTGLLYAAHEDPNPVVVFLQIYARGKREFRRLVPKDRYLIPLGKAAVKSEGKDVTVIAYGACVVQAALNEAAILAQEGISVEVIDLRTVVPFDYECCAQSVRKTGRLIIMHEASLHEGLGAYIAHDIQNSPNVWAKLLAPVRILAARDVPIPSAKVLEWDRLPFQLDEDGSRLRSSLLARHARELMEY